MDTSADLRVIGLAFRSRRLTIGKGSRIARIAFEDQPRPGRVSAMELIGPYQ